MATDVRAPRVVDRNLQQKLDKFAFDIKKAIDNAGSSTVNTQTVSGGGSVGTVADETLLWMGW